MELARSLAFVFPSCSPRLGAENWSTGDPQASGVAHWLRTGLQSARERLRASSSLRSKGRPQSSSLTPLSLAGGLVMGTGWPPPSGEAGCSHLGETTPRPQFPACLGLPSPGLAWRLSLQAWVPASTVGDRVGNASTSWPGLGPMPCVVRLVCLSAEALMGRWPGTSLSRLFLVCALVLWRVFSRG